MIEHNVVRILAAAGFTGLTGLSLGLTIVQLLRLPLSRFEARLIGALLGAAALSTIVFLMSVLSLVHPVWFGLLGAASIAVCAWRRPWRHGIEVRREPLPRAWKWIFRTGMLLYGVYTFAHALAPEVSPDGTGYHLGAVVRLIRDGGLAPNTTNMYANMPLAIEMLFLFAFSFGRHSAAALVHWQFLLLLPLLMLEFGKRFGMPRAGATGALLVFMSPLFGIDGASAYVDVATAAVVFGLFYVLMVYEHDGASGLPVAAGVLAGYAYTCKMTAFTAVPFAIVYAAWASWKHRRSPWRASLIVSVAALALMLPWLAKNAVVLGNPFSPFLNAWFPNPHVRIAFEEGYRDSLRDYYGQIQSALQVPVEVTMRGQKLNGLLGPVFLLAPLGLLALRWPVGRRVLIAAVVFLATYPSNIGSRFLLNAAPFIALALGMSVAPWRGVAAAVVLFHAWTSLPGTINLYADPHAWRMREFRWREALRLVAPEPYMNLFAAGYRISSVIEQQVPPHGKVLTYGGPAESYTTRDILVVYQSGFNNLLGEILIAGVSPEYQPTRAWEFRFNARDTRSLRLVQTNTTDQEWAISEVKVFHAGAEKPPESQWRVRAQPNPWEVGFAFDGCPITRWKSWQHSEPGMSIELDFGRMETIDRVYATVPPTQPGTSARLQVATPHGTWQTVAEAPAVSVLPAIENSRRLAVDDLKRLGVTHLAIQDVDDFISRDLYLNRSAWGITLTGDENRIKLYRLD